MDIKRVRFTARELAIITQILQLVGVLLVGKGFLSASDWELYSGIGLSVFALVLGWIDGGANDANTAITQKALGVRPDSKPAAVTVGAAVDLAGKVFAAEIEARKAKKK